MKSIIIGASLISILVISIVIIIVFVGPIDVSTQKKEKRFKDWNRSGPFATNQKQYKIGETVFIVGDGLNSNDIGTAIFVLPNKTSVYLALPFNGDVKNGFNYYFKPSLSKARNICSTDDLLGDWMVVFNGTKYEPLQFKIINETIPSEKALFQQIC